MSQRQKLDAPVSVMDTYPNAVDILASEGLIVSYRGHINFFHESFFDHIYARAFVNHDQSLVGLLTSTEQHLFRRTQVRQILEALRQNDINRYPTELSSVLFTDTIRFHIKTAVCQWLGSVEKPTEQEFEIISQFDKGIGKFHQLFRSTALSTPAWFDLLNKKNWIQKELENDDQDRTEAILWWLEYIAGERPWDIASLLRTWWGLDLERAERLLNWFSFVKLNKPEDDLFHLCNDIIISHPNCLFKKQGQNVIGLILNKWTEKAPERSGQIIHSLFKAWFVLNPGRNPFKRDELQFADVHFLNELLKKSPQAFLEGTTDTLASLIDMVVTGSGTKIDRYSFNHRAYSGHHFGFDQFLAMYRSALKKIVQEVPETANTYLEKLSPHKHQCLMHLHLEAIRANPVAFGESLPSLVCNKMVFNSGWDGAKWLSFAHACQAALPHLNFEKRMVVEQAILDHIPEIAFAIRVCRKIKQKDEAGPFLTRKSVINDLNMSKYEQWCILETIGEKRLTPVAQSRLHALRRKFPKTKIELPSHIKMLPVGPPIKTVHCDRMTDKHWLSAIERYDSDEFRRYGHNSIEGGAEELAGELQEATKKYPERFSALSIKISDKAHNSYIEHILWGLAEAEAPSDESLVQAVKHAHQHKKKVFGRAITRLLDKHPYIAADPDILEILIWYALKGEADESEESDKENAEKETMSIDMLIRRGIGFHISGINGERGRAWEALSSVLWHVPAAEKRVWDAIEIALEKEFLISVRCCMMKPLAPLFNMNKEFFSDSIRRLIILPQGSPYQFDAKRLSPLITHTCIRLFPYMFHWLPYLADELVRELIESGDEAKVLTGAWLIFCESFRNEAYIDKADELASVSVAHQRLLAAVTSSAVNWAENRHRAEALLKRFFFDEDEQVRKNAADVFRKIEVKEVELYRKLATELLKSPAFVYADFNLLKMLKSATWDVSDLVIKATHKVITDAVSRESQQKSPNIIRLHQVKDILKREYTSSESNAEARREILDLIDLMLIHETYEANEIVTTHDRW